jgi:hypothetical protein
MNKPETKTADKKQPKPSHAGFNEWIQHWQPVKQIEAGVEYLSTTQILEQVNEIYEADELTENKVFIMLKDLGFCRMRPGLGLSNMWMLKPKQETSSN